MCVYVYVYECECVCVCVLFIFKLRFELRLAPHHRSISAYPQCTRMHHCMPYIILIAAGSGVWRCVASGVEVPAVERRQKLQRVPPTSVLSVGHDYASAPPGLQLIRL